MTNNTHRFSILLFCSLLFFQILPFSASADPSSSDQWEFQLAPYAWLSGQNGTVATLPGLPPADVDVDFYDDIWGNINLAGMLVGEARKGRYGLFVSIGCCSCVLMAPARVCGRWPPRGVGLAGSAATSAPSSGE